MVLMFVVAGVMVADNTDSGSSGIEIVEVFRAETAEELEAALVDGYPMPWLEEILSDETIPEEDRYWLDCRVRAVIAQDLHLFFDEEGNPIHIEADWIAPGEDYWRENFIMNPVGEPFLYDSPDMPTNVVSEPGYVVNRFGETIGQLAMAEDYIRLSRDGSIGVTGSDLSTTEPEYPITYDNACILYADGSFKEVAAPWSYRRNYTISSDGNTIAVTSKLLASESSPREPGAILWVLNRDGSVRFTYEIHGISYIKYPLVSASGQYVVVFNGNYEEQREVILFDGNTGEILERFDDLQGMEFFFTPNERYLCIYGASPFTVTLYDCENKSEIWSREFSRDDGHRVLRLPSCDNEAEHLLVTAAMPDPLHQNYRAYLFDFVLDDINITDSTPKIAHISPEASFTVMQMNTIWQIGPQDKSLPLIVSRLTGGE